MDNERGRTTFQRAEQHIDDADVLHQQLQQLHQQLQEEVQQPQADGGDDNVHVGENSGLGPDVVGMLGKVESHHDSEAHQDPDPDQDQTGQHEDGEMEFSEELNRHVAQLALELQQQGLGNLSPEELQEHLMTQLASGQLTLPTNAAEEGPAVADAEVVLERVSENHHRPIEETSTAMLPSSMPEPIPVSIPESIPKLLPQSLPEPLPVPLSSVELSARVQKETVVDPALEALSAVTQSQTEVQESLIEPENKGRQGAADEAAEDAATTTTLEHLNELIMGMDLSDPATAIAQLQSATNIDPATLLQAVTSALSSILAGDEEEEEAEDEGERVGSQLGEDGAPRPRRKRIRKRLPPRNEEERQKLKTENRERKKRWRMRNDERNKDNDLRVRVNRRASRMFGVESSEKKTQWIENEFARRRQRRLQRIQRSFGSAGGLGNLFGQGAVSDELQAALAEIMDREGDIEKFNNTLLQLARDPNLIKNLTVMLQQMGGIGDEEGDAISTEPDHMEDYTESGAQEEMSPTSAEGSEQVGREENIIDPVLLGAELNVDNGDQGHRDEGKKIEQTTERAEGDVEIHIKPAVQDVVTSDQDEELAAKDMAEDAVTIHDEQRNADIEAVVRALQPADMEAAAQAVASFGDLELSGINIDENILLQAFSTIIANGILPETSTAEGEDPNAPEEVIQPTESAQDPESIRPRGTISRDEAVDHEGTTKPSGTTRKHARDSEGLEEPKAARRRTSLSPTSEHALPDTPSSAQSSAVATRLSEPFLPSHFVPVPPPRPAYVVSASQAPVPSPRPLPYSCPSPAMALTQEPGSTDDNPDRKKKVKAMGFPPMLKPFVAPRTAKPSSPIPGAQISTQE
ncbi:hypothetical protein V1523DRAFT_372295 [Lipomyces doorenjongii]